MSLFSLFLAETAFAQCPDVCNMFPSLPDCQRCFRGEGTLTGRPDGAGGTVYDFTPNQPTCPAGTYDSVFGCIPVGSIECGGYFCNPGQKCATGHGCLALNQDDCGNGSFCQAGHKCWQQNAQISCISAAEAYARTHAGKLAKWLQENKARLTGAASARNAIAMQYALQNKDFQDALAGVLAAKLGAPAGIARANLISQKQKEIMNAIANIALDIPELEHGDYFQSSMHIMNAVSSSTLAVLVPWGGTAADAMNIGASFATAYVFGYFWG
jgi:hypothetical protein